MKLCTTVAICAQECEWGYHSLIFSKIFSALRHCKKERDLRDSGSMHKEHFSCTTENWPCAAHAYLPCCNHVKYDCFGMEMEMQFTEQCSNYHYKNICQGQGSFWFLCRMSQVDLVYIIEYNLSND